MGDGAEPNAIPSFTPGNVVLTTPKEVELTWDLVKGTSGFGK